MRPLPNTPARLSPSGPPDRPTQDATPPDPPDKPTHHRRAERKGRVASRLAPRRLVPRRRWTRVCLGVVAALLALVVGGITGLYVTTPLPTEPQRGVTDEGSTVYFDDGRTPIFRFGANRQTVRHDQIPDRVRWAVLSAEDRGFYTGHGVSMSGTFRALWNNASGGDTQGGSTITQQLARNYYKGLSKRRTMGRKVKEILISVKLARQRNRDQILDLYLNTIYFGRQTSGVQAAARAYFGKDVWQLSVAEAALLAAMIQRPAYFRTQGNDAPARALRDRWRYVLDGMVSMGKLTRGEADAERFPRTVKEWQGVGVSGQSTFVRQRVLEELEASGIPAQSVVNGRMRIYTALNDGWMRAAGDAVRGAGESRWAASVRGGLVAVDPKDGAVRAFYGGDPARSQYDAVFNPVAQVGSTFKPFVLAAAVRRGTDVRSRVYGTSPLNFAPDGELTPMAAPGMKVKNDEHIGSLGPVDLGRATALSVNTGYMKLAFETGIGNVVRMAEDLGVPEPAIRPYRAQAGVTLGIATIPAVRQAAAYAAFANGGIAVAPHLVTRIVDASGHDVPLPWARTGARVLSHEQAAQVNWATRRTVTEGTGRRAALPGRVSAGKTGTTDHNRAAWYVGYVPNLSTAVMMADTRGRTLRDAAHRPISGEDAPTVIWHAFMARISGSLPVRAFDEPVFAGTVRDWTDSRVPVHPARPPSGRSEAAGTPGQRPDGTPPPSADPKSKGRGKARH
ncbi:transglycosylase domain-containing protein [Actinomadura harenae]|uniref:Penicillin-binding protein n=1 Tax=Actinomadura harenae TaxID=2483351 RepID=A0A3M2L1R2_9ACTN|nr:transglycosylase domain-containing protein [Actinomadura harenae]RMI31597.1 penicillin-binding protein [Actinomadura harenae]